MTDTLSFTPSEQGRELLTYLKAHATAHREAIDAGMEDLSNSDEINDAWEMMHDTAWAIIDNAYGVPLSAEGETGDDGTDWTKFPQPRGPVNLADLTLVVFGLHMDGALLNRNQQLALHRLIMGVLEVAGIPREAVDFDMLFAAVGRQQPAQNNKPQWHTAGSSVVPFRSDAHRRIDPLD